MMNVGPVSSFSTYRNVQNEKLVKSDASQGFFQSLNLEANKQINLGSINGKSLDMKIFQDGGFEWSGARRIFCHSGNAVTSEDAAAAYASSLYTENEHEQGSHISAIINQIYLVANKGLATSSFNEFIIKNSNISQEEIDQAFDRLGLDTSAPFTVNGRTFVLNSGTLNDYDEAK